MRHPVDVSFVGPPALQFVGEYDSWRSATRTKQDSLLAYHDLQLILLALFIIDSCDLIWTEIDPTDHDTDENVRGIALSKGGFSYRALEREQ